jgi:hypothetical protein
MQHLGAFGLPGETFGGSRFGHGGGALSVVRDGSGVSLLVGGHVHQPGTLAQVAVPLSLGRGALADLPVATVLQPFRDVTAGALPEGWQLYGTLPWGERLVLAASEYYDADGDQAVSHAMAPLDPTTPDPVPVRFRAISALAPPRAMGGYLGVIPEAWRDALGGPAITGQCCLPIISATSSGPALTAFDPADLDREGPVAGTTLAWYPLEHELAPGTTQNPLFTLATQVVGVALPPGARSVLVIGRHGTGPYCYGPGTDDPALAGSAVEGSDDRWCLDPTDGSKGTHAWPYRHQVWAYDALELSEVVAGIREPWDVRPYATWALEGAADDGSATAVSAAYDPFDGRLYLTEAYGEEPHVHVFQVTVPGS